MMLDNLSKHPVGYAFWLNPLELERIV